MDIVGIDLGTTNSLVGAVVDGKVTLFADAKQDELLPSVVGLGANGELLVGRSAKNRRVLDPLGTASSVKRKMGGAERVRVGDKELSAVEVSALILGALLDRAETALGKRPARAVITVPAYFDDAQRQATRDAGELAGLVVERLINEPTAAALTYHTGEEQTVLVYDLGGGTFDVSVLERDEGLLEVLQSRGDTRLGGDDIDRALTELVLDRLGDGRRRVEADPRAMTRLVEAVERAKIALSDRAEVRLFDPFLAGDGAEGVHLDMTLAASDVERVAKPFVERTLTCIDAALHAAGIRPADLDRVLLVGGASKMPLVTAMISAHLGRPAQLDSNADRAVALGASLLAGRIGGADVAEVLVDITPHTLVVGVLSEGAADDLDALAVIPRGTVVPVERSQTVMTQHTNQPAAMLPIAQGEEEAFDDNTYLGEVVVEPLPPSPAGSPVEVTFRLDLSGILYVSATHVASGTSAETTISNSPYRLTSQTRAAAKQAVADLRATRQDEASADQVGSLQPMATDGDLSLAEAMLKRSRRALETRAAEPSAELARAAETTATLASAVKTRAPEVAELTDALADALLDLV